MLHHHQRPAVAAEHPGTSELAQNLLLPMTSGGARDCFGGAPLRKPGFKDARLLRFAAVLFLVSLAVFFAPRFLFSDNPCGTELSGSSVSGAPAAAICSPDANNTICCDCTSFRSDICFMSGDIRMHSASSSIFLNLPPAVTHTSPTAAAEHRIRPYTRKWETSVMSTIDELRLLPIFSGDGGATAASAPSCDVTHKVPAVVFSTGGYTGNLYHEFNDGILPLFITSQHFNKNVIFVLLEYHEWWISKYGDVLSKLSDYPAVDFSKDSRIHCFPEAIVGLRIHDELQIDPTKMPNDKTIADFRQLLDEAYKPRFTKTNDEEELRKIIIKKNKPKLVIISRNGSRMIENEEELVRTAEEVGFQVKVLLPTRSSELFKIYGELDTCDAMVGVHGAALTHLLFMKPGSVFIQIVPLGTDWAAEAYYGGPARKAGLKYMRYQVTPPESSLFRGYGGDDPVIRDPESVNSKGWEMTKKIYLDGQNVMLDLRRFRKHLLVTHKHVVHGGGR